MLPGTGWATPRLCQRLQRYPQTSGSLAHRVEQGTFNPKVPGSSPGRPTTCWPWPLLADVLVPQVWVFGDEGGHELHTHGVV